MNDTTRLLGLALPLFVAPLAGCSKDAGDGGDTDVVDTDVVDTDVVDTDETDLPPGCGDGAIVADTLCFGAPVPGDAGGHPVALAIGDWDGEGPDVLLAVGSTVRVATNDGAGAMGSPATDAYTLTGEGTPPELVDLAVGHVDDGAELDLVVASSNWSAEVAFGSGTGTVDLHTTFYAGEGFPLDVDVADLGGTGPGDDLVTANSGGACGSVVMTNGDEASAFTQDTRSDLCTPAYIALGRSSNAWSSAIGVAGDTLSAWAFTTDGSTVTVVAPTTVTLQADATRVATGDLDGDGYDEALVPLTSGELDVLFSDGEAGWVSQGATAYVAHTVGAGPTDVATGDLDGDGDLDVAVVGADAAIVVLVNDGSGGLTATSLPLAAGTVPERVATGDLNGDGVDDLAVTTSSPDGFVVLLSNP